MGFYHFFLVFSYLFRQFWVFTAPLKGADATPVPPTSYVLACTGALRSKGGAEFSLIISVPKFLETEFAPVHAWLDFKTLGD